MKIRVDYMALVRVVRVGFFSPDHIKITRKKFKLLEKQKKEGIWCRTYFSDVSEKGLSLEHLKRIISKLNTNVVKTVQVVKALYFNANFVFEICIKYNPLDQLDSLVHFLRR
ncbi:MAG: hypothetical protein QFX36_04075 [Archaeoglobales archaeon]|nr:hypothetical protein [Archaeoglobales archaeon]